MSFTRFTLRFTVARQISRRKARTGSDADFSVDKFWVAVAKGIHPFPSRTRKLSPSAPIVLHARVCGRLGSRPVKFKSPANKLGFFYFWLRFFRATSTIVIHVSRIAVRVSSDCGGGSRRPRGGGAGFSGRAQANSRT